MSELSLPFNSNFNSKLYILSLVLLSKNQKIFLVAIEDDSLKADVVKTKHSRTRI